ncbi:DUF3389 family protein [Vibrio gangliei]|uniref:DUF3389 family protein n=1 Tax=Vibrio gangliei TaxID=2077090 RepID=UPI000D012207|nr:DUF3389 family protein [Vibrio gangliei]
MIIEFSQGKIIANLYDVVVRFNSVPSASLQCHVDAIKLIGRGANVITAHDVQCQWTVKLDNEHQLQNLADFLGIPIQ